MKGNYHFENCSFVIQSFENAPKNIYNLVNSDISKYRLPSRMSKSEKVEVIKARASYDSPLMHSAKQIVFEKEKVSTKLDFKIKDLCRQQINYSNSPNKRLERSFEDHNRKEKASGFASSANLYSFDDRKKERPVSAIEFSNSNLIERLKEENLNRSKMQRSDEPLVAFKLETKEEKETKYELWRKNRVKVTMKPRQEVEKPAILFENKGVLGKEKRTIKLKKSNFNNT